MSAAAPRTRFANPPVLEAVMELQFLPSAKPWDSVYLGKLHDRMQSVMKLPDVRDLFGASIVFGPLGADVQTVRDTRKRFSSTDGAFVVTVGPNVLGFSVLARKRDAGHPGWNEIRENAFRLLAIYRSVTESGPVCQIGVRYVNVVPVNPDSFRIDQYLSTSSGWIAPRFSSESKPFVFRYETVSEGVHGWAEREGVSIAARPNETGQGELIVDIDEITHGASELPDQLLQELAERMHSKTWSVFSSVFSAELQIQFGPNEAEWEAIR